MRRVGKIAMAAAAALSLFAIGSARAETVTYTTTGVFGNGSNVISSGGETITFAGIGSGLTLTDSATGMTYVAPASESYTVTPTSPEFLANFGGFSSSGSLDIPGDTFNTSFTLTIDETVPGSGTGTAVATVDGTINSIGNGDVVVAYSPVNSPPLPGLPAAGDGTTQIGGVTYTLYVDEIPGDGLEAQNGEISTTSNSNGTPLPSSALAGTGLLCLLGGSKLVRKARTA